VMHALKIVEKLKLAINGHERAFRANVEWVKKRI
jgi:hypothetical protein